MSRPLAGLALALCVLVCAGSATARQWLAADEGRWREMKARLLREEDEKFQALGFAPIAEAQASGRIVRRLLIDDEWGSDLAVEAERLADATVHLRVFFDRTPSVDAILPATIWPRITQNEGVVLPPMVFQPSPPGTPRPPPPSPCHGRNPSIFSTGVNGVRHEWRYCGANGDGAAFYAWVDTLTSVAVEAKGCPADSDYVECFAERVE